MISESINKVNPFPLLIKLAITVIFMHVFSVNFIAEQYQAFATWISALCLFTIFIYYQIAKDVAKAKELDLVDAEAMLEDAEEKERLAIEIMTKAKLMHSQSLRQADESQKLSNDLQTLGKERQLLTEQVQTLGKQLADAQANERTLKQSHKKELSTLRTELQIAEKAVKSYEKQELERGRVEAEKKRIKSIRASHSAFMRNPETYEAKMNQAFPNTDWKAIVKV